MDDDLEEKVLKQACVSQMKFVSRFAIGFFNRPGPGFLSSFQFLMRSLIRPEFFFLVLLLFIVCFYLQFVELDSNWLNKISSTLKFRTKTSVSFKLAVEKDSWEKFGQSSASYAIQGRRNGMEDRFILDENINSCTDVAFFAIFDGHGGELAAEFVKHFLVQNLYKKITESKEIIKNHEKNRESKNDDSICNDEISKRKEDSVLPTVTVQRKLSGRKAMSKTDDDNKNSVDSDILDKLKPQKGFSLFKQTMATNDTSTPPTTYDAKCYIQKENKIDYVKMITDEVLFADYKLLEIARKNSNVAGTTALISIIDGTRLIVSNIGDSRAVMCNFQGKTIPLSFDHKPQAAREHKRIQEAGGFIAFKGVWRVSGILATSRAMGDYPLKPNLVIANPDILEFDLSDHKPQFIILASDGLWDTFSNEEAVSFIKDHLNEQHFGSKSITLESFRRGSVDNISCIVIVFKSGKYYIASSADE